jgi:hypothetical protein
VSVEHEEASPERDEVAREAPDGPAKDDPPGMDAGGDEARTAGQGDDRGADEATRETVVPAAEASPEPAADVSRDAAGPLPPMGSEGRRPTEGRLARLHLRVGLLALARAELETMAADGILDIEAMADLAEARWRSGDLVGAGEAAQAHLGSGGDETLAHVVAAESLAAQGRTGDARQHVTTVMERVGAQVEALFSGQPRSRLWPRAPEAGSAGASVESVTDAVGAGTPQLRLPLEGATQPGGEARPSGRRERMPQAVRLDEAPRPHDDAGEQLAAVRADLDGGRLAAVAARLSLLVRTEPRLAAPIVGLAEEALEHVDPDGLEAASLHLVRGDAYRLLGRELEAVAAFQGSRRPIKASATGEPSAAGDLPDEPDSPHEPGPDAAHDPESPEQPHTHDPDDHSGPEETT